MNIKKLVFLTITLMITEVGYAQRYALVIGNGNYKLGVLKNPANDASDMAALLRKKGFQVQKLINANEKKMKQEIRQFTNRLYQKNAVGLFYYAGHGIEVGGRNYLIPLDANIENEDDVEFESVDVGRVMAGMEKAGNNLNIVILDACRNNPFARSFRSSSRGLARMDAAKGSLVLYATSPGDVASDGSGRNGLFTQHLMTSINQPNIIVEQVFKQTAKKVYQATGGKQTPWQSGVIIDNFYFTITAPQAKIANISVPTTSNKQAEIAFWESIKNEKDSAFFSSYLKKFPKGIYAQVALLKIQHINPIVATKPAETAILKTARLTIQTSPGNAKVRILNIIPKYYDGIALKSGRYHIEITKKGYLRHTEWLNLATEDKVYSIVLTAQNKKNLVTLQNNFDKTHQSKNTSSEANSRTGRYLDEKDCLRNSDGSYVSGFRNDCK